MLGFSELTVPGTGNPLEVRRAYWVSLFAPMRNADELLTTGRPFSSRHLRSSMEKRKFMSVGVK